MLASHVACLFTRAETDSMCGSIVHRLSAAPALTLRAVLCSTDRFDVGDGTGPQTWAER